MPTSIQKGYSFFKEQYVRSDAITQNINNLEKIKEMESQLRYFFDRDGKILHYS